MNAHCKIVIDATPLDTSHRFRGIGTYVRGLLEGLAQCVCRLPMVQLRIGRGDPVNPAIEMHSIYRPRWPRTRLRWILNEILLPGSLEETGAKLFHATDPRSIPRKGDKTLIATAYDLIPLVFPDYYLASFPWDERLSYQRSLQRYREADHLIAISEATKRDFIRYLSLDPGTITVVPLGYDADLFKPSGCPVPPEYDIPERFFLYVGAHDRRKNIERMLRAYAQVRRAMQEKFVLAGKLTRQESSKFEEWVSRLGLGDAVRNLGFVPRELLPLLYSRATAFVFPSLYEGFGLPPLEAMACGCPVIASAASSIPEVVADAGFLFDPEDEEELAGLLVELANDADLRDRYRALSLARAARFGWKQCAESTLAVYERFALAPNS